jgi:hypothetical protein
MATRGACVVLLALLAATGIALAAQPVKGGTYSGKFTTAPSESVTFKVSKNGAKVFGLKVSPSPPNKCGSGGPPPKQSSKPAAISSKGKFTATVSYETVSGKVFATAKVTGKFLKHGAESGIVASKFTDPATKMCQGSFNYTTKAG